MACAFGVWLYHCDQGVVHGREKSNKSAISEIISELPTFGVSKVFESVLPDVDALPIEDCDGFCN